MFPEVQRAQIIAPWTANKRDVCATVCCNEQTPFASESPRKTRADHLYRSSDGDHGIGYFVRCIGSRARWQVAAQLECKFTFDCRRVGRLDQNPGWALIHIGRKQQSRSWLSGAKQPLRLHAR